jgi:ABC-2 type transport system ATP-binding protein
VRDLVREGTTVLLTTQYLEEADQLTDRIVVIDHGRVIAEGTGDELKDSVGSSVVEVRLEDPVDRDRALDALRAVGCEEPQSADQPAEVILPAHDGVGTVEAVARALDAAGIPVTDLSLRRPTLDDVFLELTGAHVEGSADGSRPSEQVEAAA